MNLIEKNYTDTYREARWGNIHLSGDGSTYEKTINDSIHLKSIISEFNIKSIIDAPCGSFSWIYSHGVTDLIDYYLGVDVVKYIIEDNKKFENSKIKFNHINLVDDNYNEWSSDLILCKEMTQHLTNESTIKVLNKFKNTKCKYLLITNHPEMKKNISTPTWGSEYGLDSAGYRSQNLDIEPYNLLNKIKDYYVWDFVEGDGINMKKYLSLYKLN